MSRLAQAVLDELKEPKWFGLSVPRGLAFGETVRWIITVSRSCQARNADPGVVGIHWEDYLRLTAESPMPLLTAQKIAAQPYAGYDAILYGVKLKMIS